MAFWDNFLSSGIEGAAKGVGQLAKDLRAAITGKEALTDETRLTLETIAERLEQAEIGFATTLVSQVNETMRAEAASEHWMQWSWRPFNGYLYGLSIIAVYFALPLAKIAVPKIPYEVWLGWGAILGVASWHRGAQKRGV